MSLLRDLEQLGEDLGGDVTRLVPQAVALIEARVQQHPQRVFDLLRTVRPVLVLHGVAVVTRYRDVVEVLQNDRDFSVSSYAPPMSAVAGEFVLGLDDGPRYERALSLLHLAFRQDDVPSVESLVTRAATELVQSHRPTGRLDVVKDVSDRVPATLVAQWLGVPGPDQDTLIAWARALFEEIFVNLKHERALTERAAAAAGALRPYIDGLVADRQHLRSTGQDGPDDVLGRLIRQQALGRQAFTDEEIRNNLVGLLVGCIPTTSKASALVIDELLRRPRELAAASAAARAGDTDLLGRYVREAMRFAPQAPGLFRVARRDVVIAAGTHHATTLRSGDLVFAATQSAMLDGDVFADPDEFRTDRDEALYLHDGAGMHTCLGRYLNRVQIPAVVGAVLGLPGLRRAAGDTGDLVLAGNFPEHLQVEFEPGSP